MPPLQSLVKTASALALIASFAAPALADDSELYGVASIDVGLSGAVPQVTVRNVAANHQLQNLQLAVQEAQVAVQVGANVACTGTESENWVKREGHYLSHAAYGVGKTSLLLSKDMPHSTSIDRVSHLEGHSFQMPVALLSNPQIAVNPVAVVLAAADQAPDKVAFLRQDQVINVTFPLRIEAGCAWYSRNKVTKQTIKESPQLSYLTKNVTLKIKYEGDPKLIAFIAQVAQGGNPPNQLDGGYQPFKITTMNFQPNMPHHIGACPATTTIRVQYQGLGKGTLQMMIYDGAKVIDGPHVFVYESSNGEDYYYFDIDTPQPSASNLNKTVSHNLSVKIRTKDWQSQNWTSQYELMDTAIWNARCTPQVNPVLGGKGGGAKVGGYQGNNGGGANAAPALRLAPAAPPPPPAPARLAPATGGDPVPPKPQRAQ